MRLYFALRDLNVDPIFKKKADLTAQKMKKIPFSQCNIIYDRDYHGETCRFHQILNVQFVIFDEFINLNAFMELSGNLSNKLSLMRHG